MDKQDLTKLASLPLDGWRESLRKCKKLANEYAASHVKELGYVVVSSPDDPEPLAGGSFFIVDNGKAQSVGACDCLPATFAGYAEERREREEWRKRELKHPTCPCCSCLRK